MDRNEKLLIQYYYGPDVKIERRLFKGHRIVAPIGEVDITDDGFKEIIGDSEMYRVTLLFARNRWRTVKVSGSAQHVTACMAHGKELGIAVVPEGEKENATVLAIGFAFLGFCWGLLFGLFFGDAFAGGVINATLSFFIFKALIERSQDRDARRAGQQYRNPFPEFVPSDREAKSEAARRRGLL